ncbi:MAG: sugar ABC transporter ATP-binding protein [Blastocatellales bacterium]
MGEPILQFEKIEKSFYGVRVLRGVSFALEEGHILGLVGENGAGKSTLMNILGGVMPFDAGRMLLGGEEYSPRNPSAARARGVAFIHQELNLFTNLSVAENIFITDFPKWRVAGVPLINRREMKARTRSLLKSLDLSVAPEALVEYLSPGERQLVEVAKAMSIEAKIIILDEPTTSLTARETARLFTLLERLRAQGVSMIYISHNLGDALRLCDDVVVLRDGEVAGAGRKSEFTEERMIALMVGRTLDQLFPERPERVDAASQEIALEVNGLLQRGVLEGISFRLRKGEVLGVAGLMGAGRTELARALFGLYPIEQGEVLINGKPAPATPRGRIQNGMAFLTEDRRAEGLMMEAGVAENIALAALPSFLQRGARPVTGLLNQAEIESAIDRVAQSVRIRGAADMRQAVKTLSGGNQQKVVLARWLLDKPSVFILDEPTRGVDVGAKSEIYRIINDLAEGGAGVLMISSEIEELIGMCDRILVMAAGRITDCVERAEFDRERIMRSALGNAGGEAGYKPVPR